MDENICIKEIEKIYWFDVMNKIKKGNVVYYFNKAISEKRQACNEMTVAEFANVIEEENAEFWVIEEKGEEN